MTNRRGVVADPEIVDLAQYIAGVLASVLRLDQTALLERARPSDKLKAGRYVLIGIMHHHFCFNEKTGKVARRSDMTNGAHWREISQQRIAAALKRDRGVISDAWHAMEDAIVIDFDVAYALDAMADAMVPVIECGMAWQKALEQRQLDNAEALAAARHAYERAEDDDDDEPSVDEEASKVITHRCHACKGKGAQRIHRLSNDRRYQEAWAIAQAAQPTPDGFHELTCVSCGGSGQTVIQSRRGGAL